jgi:hypothetical protein
MSASAISQARVPPAQRLIRHLRLRDQISVHLPCDTRENEKGLGPVELLPAARQKMDPIRRRTVLGNSWAVTWRRAGHCKICTATIATPLSQPRAQGSQRPRRSIGPAWGRGLGPWHEICFRSRHSRGPRTSLATNGRVAMALAATRAEPTVRKRCRLGRRSPCLVALCQPCHRPLGVGIRRCVHGRAEDEVSEAMDCRNGRGGVAPCGPHELCGCARGSCAPGVCGVATRRRHPPLSPVSSLLWLVSVCLPAMSDGVARCTHPTSLVINTHMGLAPTA